ncbi:hypothetical protein GGR34_001608 [Microvirga flocculans]|uniref:Uncharacterized protein n=1 Tax=Microvirga flocculans TaxID=217168 RepID=A0A7W6N7V7_9HYPH|nr:hypothetical protein [Microvirga flocculans]MBB4039961.1 hypothetical protein [Microvirga flocculans]
MRERANDRSRQYLLAQHRQLENPDQNLAPTHRQAEAVHPGGNRTLDDIESERVRDGHDAGIRVAALRILDELERLLDRAARIDDIQLRRRDNPLRRLRARSLIGDGEVRARQHMRKANPQQGVSAE